MGSLAASLKQTRFADAPNFRGSRQPGQIGQPSHAVSMRFVRLVPALLLLPIALASLAPSAGAAQPAMTIEFTVFPGFPQSWEMTVPSRGQASIDVIVLEGGSALGFDLDGPGTCAGASVSPGPGSPFTPASRASVDCGLVYPTNGPLEIGTLGGFAHGYLVLHGFTAAT